MAEEPMTLIEKLRNPQRDSFDLLTMSEAADVLDGRRILNNALLSENGRLRRALESIAENTCCGPCQEAATVAKAALAPQSQ
jgi:hypothetical protein